MDISMYGMQPQPNGYHHHHPSSVSSADIMYAANTNYYPNTASNQQVINNASGASLNNINNNNNRNSANNPSGGPAAAVQHRSNNSVDVFPITRSSGAQQSVSPVIVTSSSSSAATMPSSTASGASAAHPIVNVVSNVTALSNQNHYPVNLYSPSAIEYGITTTGSPNGPTVDFEAYYHASPNDGGGGGGGPGVGHPNPDTNIINTDSGLSYTNLDYMYANQQGQHHNSVELPGYPLGDECQPPTTNTPPSAWLSHPNQSAHMIMHNHLQAGSAGGGGGGAHHSSPPSPSVHSNNNNSHHHLHNHPNPHLMHPGQHHHHLHGGATVRQFIDPAMGHHNQLANHQQIQTSSNLVASGSGSPIAGSMHPAQIGPNSPQQQHHHHLHSPVGHQQQSNSNQNSGQQTFKWMQIKRNVPKPQGESSEFEKGRGRRN